MAGQGNSTFIKILSLPGLALQKLTTLPPDDKQLEVAIAALKAVLNAEGPKEFVGITDIEGNLFPETEEALMGKRRKYEAVAERYSEHGRSAFYSEGCLRPA